MNQTEFIDQVIQISRKKGFRVETNRNGQAQIDFGHKKLHSGHLSLLFPKILSPGAHVGKLIDSVAPGRPCSHKPMREIVEQITKVD